jgi:hypothetical protein
VPSLRHPMVTAAAIAAIEVSFRWPIGHRVAN